MLYVTIRTENLPDLEPLRILLEVPRVPNSLNSNQNSFKAAWHFVCAFISGGVHVFTYRPYYFDPASHLLVLPVITRPVRKFRLSQSLLLVLLLWHLGLYGCIQRARVEAAAESPQEDSGPEQDF